MRNPFTLLKKAINRGKTPVVEPTINKPSERIREERTKVEIPEDIPSHIPPVFESYKLAKLRRERAVHNRMQRKSRIINRP